MLIHQAFGLVLKEEREKRGLSQEKLAELADLSRTYIYYLEAGRKTPTLTIFYTLCKSLEISPETMMATVIQKMDTP